MQLAAPRIPREALVTRFFLAGIHRPVLVGLSLLAALAGALTPAGARAGKHGEAPPAAVRFSISLDAMIRGSTFSAQADGVFNASGDARATVTLSGRETHTLSIIEVAGIGYVSIDGSAYEADELSGLFPATPSSVTTLSQPNLLPASAPSEACMSAAETAASPLDFFSDLALEASANFSTTETATVDGTPVRHVQGRLDLGQFLAETALPQELETIAAACGGESISPSDLQELTLLASGSELDVDAYLQEPGDFPRWLSLGLTVPFASLDAQLQADITPLDAPVTIVAPTGP